jgi:hypothetical protein
MPGHDSLLHAPRALGTRLQQFLVVIRLDHHGMCRSHALVHELGGESQIREEPERGAAMMQNEAEWFHRIVRHRKTLDINVANPEIATRNKQAPVLRHFLVAAQSFGGEPIAVYRRLEVFAPDIEAAAVVAVLMRQEDPIDLEWIAADHAQPLESLPRTQAPIDQ